MTDIQVTPDEPSNINDTPLLSNGSSSITTTASSPSEQSATKPTTMPVSRKIRLQQMLWHSLMEAKGEIVGVTKTNGDTYSGVLFAIEAADGDTNTTMDNNPNIDNENTNAAWKYIVLKYVQKMSDPNMNPSERIRAPFEEELKIPASDFAALSAINITDHTNSYRRSNRQAFNDASGTKLHRKQRELVRWEAVGHDNADLENEDDLDDLRNGSYDQFKANEKYNIEATFDESVYTSNLDKSNPNYQRNLKEAKIREQHIMSQVTDNKHVADDRAYYNSHNHHNMHNDNSKEQDEEDAYSRVLHEASLSKQSLKDSKKKNSYVAPHMRGKAGNNNSQNQGKNKGRNKTHNKGKNNKNNKTNNNLPDRHRPPLDNNNNNNNNQNKNKGNNNTNHANNKNNKNNNKNNNNQNKKNANNNVVNGVVNNHQNNQNNQNNNSPTHNNQAQQSQQLQQQQQQQALLANMQNQMLQAKLAQLSANNPIFAGLPPHIAQIVQSVNPTQTAIPQTMQLTQQQLQVYQQLVLAQQNLSLAQQAQQQAQQANNNNNNTDPDAITNNKAGDTMDRRGETEGPDTQLQLQLQQMTGGITGMAGMKDDGGSLNPHAMEFTPQISPTPIKQQSQHPHQTTQASQNITPAQPAQLLTQQQQQQALQAQILSQQPLGQYNFNPATGQYVLNPYAQQGQQQQLQLLQQQQHNAYLQQLAIQQQLQLQQTQGQADPSGTIVSQQGLQQTAQQQLLAQHQQQLALQQQQQALLAQQQVQAQAQANGLNIGAPLFTPTNIPTQQATQAPNNQLALQQQQQQAQQQAILAQHQQLQQQYLSFGAIPQQPQFYMQNMQNLMQQ